MHCAERVSDRAVASDNSGSEEGKEDGLGGLPVGIVHCVEGRWSKRKEEECSPMAVSGDRKRPTIDRLYCRYS